MSNPPSNTNYTTPPSAAPKPPPECAAEGCEASVTALTGFCGPHWRALPPSGQRVVSYHRGAARQSPHDKRAAANAALAVRVATVLIAFMERRWSQRHAMDQIAEASATARRGGATFQDIDTTVRAIGWDKIVEGRDAGEGKQLELGGGGKKR
jgi:hypothetical protein